jgi:hypothetical protein
MLSDLGEYMYKPFPCSFRLPDTVPPPPLIYIDRGGLSRATPAALIYSVCTSNITVDEGTRQTRRAICETSKDPYLNMHESAMSTCPVLARQPSQSKPDPLTDVVALRL